VDHIRNRLSIDAFGGKKMSIRFDDRTHVFRDGVETTQLAIHKGDRVYVDSQLDQTKVFARNIHILSESTPADARGQLIHYDPRTSTIAMQDELSATPVRFRIDKGTAIKRQGAAGGITDLQTGALIAVHFVPDAGN